MEQFERRDLGHSYGEDMSHDEQQLTEFELAQTIENRMLEHEQEREEQRNKILKTYHDVWDEFYEWEPEPCRSVVRSLQCALVKSIGGTSVPLHFSDGRMDIDEVDGDTFKAFDIEQDQLCRLDLDIVHMPAFIPHPKYEACTPASQNIRTHRYPQWLDFIPYADEGFQARTLLGNRRYFVWQDAQRDPDANIIELRAIHVLENQSFSYNIIDAHSVLPRLFDHNGLIRRFSSCDLWHLPHWPDVPKLPCIPLNEYNMKTQINEYVDKMCPHMGCLYNLCFLHNDIADPFSGNMAHVKSGILQQKIQRPCGDMCCTLDREIMEESFMEDVQLMQDILSLIPDEIPCIVASIVKLPCYQVFRQRCQLFPDWSIAPARVSSGAPVIGAFEDDSQFEGNPSGIDFCYHQGPCGLQCPCYKARMHCKRNCRCDMKCKLRYKGCRCKAEDCQDPLRCPCKQARRECDPEICGPIKLRKKGRIHKCPNALLQQAIYPELSTRTGQHGQGIFALKNMPKSTAIGEYTAELFPNEFSEELDLAQKHRHLNYAFNLNADQILDSAWIGNDTRYLNHAQGEGENTVAETQWVNGEHRIVFYSTRYIKKGEELQFNYGENYWLG